MTVNTLAGVANLTQVNLNGGDGDDSFAVTQTSGDGVVVQNASNVLVSGNHVSYSGQPTPSGAARGIRFVTVSDSIVEQNTVDHNTAYGIYIDVGSTRDIVRGNNCFRNAFGYQRAASGIRIHTSSGNTISSAPSRSADRRAHRTTATCSSTLNSSRFDANG